MTVVIAVSVVLVSLGAAAVVMTSHPKRQALAVSAFGLLLTVLFVALQAPDVALSELVINALVIPLVILLAAEKIGKRP